MIIATMCVAATLLDAAICLALERYLSTPWRADVSGSPLFSWYVGALHQGIIFPVCTLIALWPVVSGNMAVGAWLRASFSDGSAPAGCVWTHVALLAYWAKDCLVIKLSALIWAHHVICLCAVVSSLTGLLPQSAGVFTLGSVVLELGSFANSVCEVQPGKRGKAVRPRLTPIMLASNALAIGLVVWAAFTFDGTIRERVVWWCAAAVGTALSALRQQEWNDRVHTDEVGQRFRTAAPKTSR